MHLFLLLFVSGLDFPVAVDTNDQNLPAVVYACGQYYIFWNDLRYYSPDRSVFAARVTTDGQVLDPQGIEILRDRTEFVDAAFDGINFLVVLQDSC
ncbi:MAG TPA: hypothetical protein VF399_05645 [bacterium]